MVGYIRAANEADRIETEVVRQVMARAADTSGALSFTVVTIPPRFRGPNLHVHPEAAEIFFVLEGDLLVRIGEREDRVGPGAFVYAPAGTPHTFASLSDQPARQIVIYTPAGPEAWFDELADLRARNASAEEFAAARTRFGSDANVVGPRLETPEDA